MNPNTDNSREVVERLLILLAILAIAALVGVTFAVYRPAKEASSLLLPGIFSSVVAVLLIYLASKTLLRGTEMFLSDRSIMFLSDRLATEIESRERRHPLCYARWNDVPWTELLRDARKLEFHVSYMDTWITLATDALVALCSRGGAIRAYLPVVDEAAVARVKERFPEYNADLVSSKIANTSVKLRAVLNRARNPSARLEIRRTPVFIMHCLMKIDDHTIVLSPFDHFRRTQIEGPAFVVDTRDYPHIAAWAEKEFEGFKANSTPEPEPAP